MKDQAIGHKIGAWHVPERMAPEELLWPLGAILFSGYLRGIYSVPRLHPVNRYREHRVAQGMAEAACATDTPVVAD